MLHVKGFIRWLGPQVMRVLTGACMLAVLLAGCASEAPDTPASSESDRSDFQRSPPVALPHTAFTAEPRIAALPDGTLFVSAPTGFQSGFNAMTGAAYLWRSTDDGLSWETLRSPQAGSGAVAWCSCDSDVTTSPDGWVYSSDWWLASPGVGNFQVEASPDGGATWTSTPVTMPMATNIDRQWLAAGPDGLVVLTYSFTPPYRLGLVDGQPQGGFDREIWAVTSQDHGQTWSAPSQVVDFAPGAFNHAAHPFILADGTILVPDGFVPGGVNGWDQPTEVRLYRSTDAGTSWTYSVAAHVPQGMHYVWSLQGATDGTRHVDLVWTALGEGGVEALWTVASDDAGLSWAEPEMLVAAGANYYPWIDERPDGSAAIVWYGNASLAGEPVRGDEWFAMVGLRAGPAGPWTIGRADALPVKVGNVCVSACDGDNELRDFLSVTLAADGMAHVAYMRIDASGAGQALVAGVSPG
jgi:hypothetical protein